MRPFTVPAVLLAACAVAHAVAYAGAASAAAAQPDVPASSPAAASAPASGAPAVDGGPQALPMVQTHLQRGSFMPYKRLNALLSTLRTEGEGLFVSRLTMRPSDSNRLLPANARLALMDDERTIDIPIGPGGRFELPTFPASEAGRMELGTNLAKGSVGVQVVLDITTPAERLDMAGVRRLVRVGQHLRDELLPWYVRWLTPQIDGVLICSDRPQWQLEWQEDGQTLALPLQPDLSAREPETGAQQPSRPCTSLTGQERWPDEARLQLPPGHQTRLHVKLRQPRAS